MYTGPPPKSRGAHVYPDGSSLCRHYGRMKMPYAILPCGPDRLVSRTKTKERRDAYLAWQHHVGLGYLITLVTSLNNYFVTIKVYF